MEMRIYSCICTKKKKQVTLLVLYILRVLINGSTITVSYRIIVSLP